MTDSLQRKNAGFTLIELLIYMGIVSIILVSISYLMIDVLSGSAGSVAKSEISQTARVVMEQMRTDMHQATSIESIDTQTVTLSGADNQTFTYHFDEVKKSLTVTHDEAVYQLHADSIEIEGSFADLSFLNKNKTVGVTITFRYKNPSGRREFNAEQTVYTSFNLYGTR